MVQSFVLSPSSSSVSASVSRTSAAVQPLPITSCRSRCLRTAVHGAVNGDDSPLDDFEHSWCTPAVGEAANSVTIIDRDTELPTAVNFGGPKPDSVTVAPPPPELLQDFSCQTADDVTTGTFVQLFRGSAPYLRMHRGATFVIHIPGEVLEGPCFQGLMDDIGLLALLGVQLVLVVGSRPQTNSLMARLKLQPRFVSNVRITDAEAIKVCKEAAGYVRFEVERSLMRGQRGGASSISVSGGNFFSAQPIGVRNGVDYGFTGEVRRVEADKIRARLSAGDVVQLTSIGFSSSGEVFHVDTEALAAETAVQIGAAKVIYFTEGQRMVVGARAAPLHTLRLREARALLRHFGEDPEPEVRAVPEAEQRRGGGGGSGSGSGAGAQRSVSAWPASHPNGERNYTAAMMELLSQSVRALARGVARAHIVSPSDGSLLQELFTRDGSGLLVSRDIYDGIRPACASDIPGIFEIIHPLERAGILVERSQAQLEQELPNFFVFTRDGATVACAYLKRYSADAAEIGALAVHPAYRRGGRGEAMLGYLERVAVLSGITRIFVLSTRTMEWFVEHGFAECGVDDLPESRREQYNWARRSKVYLKRLAGTRAIDAEELFWDIQA